MRVYIYIYKNIHILRIYFSSILHPWQVVVCSAIRLFGLNEFNRGSVSASASARTTSYKQPMTREWKIAADWQWGLPDCHRRWSRCKGFVSSRWCRAFFGVIPVVQCRVCVFCFLMQNWTCFFLFLDFEASLRFSMSRHIDDFVLQIAVHLITSSLMQPWGPQVSIGHHSNIPRSFCIYCCAWPAWDAMLRYSIYIYINIYHIAL